MTIKVSFWKLLFPSVLTAVLIYGSSTVKAQAVESPEHTHSFKYIDNLGRQRIAHLDDTWVTEPSGADHDPDWVNTDSKGAIQENLVDWLHFKGKDNGSWVVKVHIHGQETGFGWDFETKHPDDANGHNGDFLFLGWDGVVYKVTGLKFGRKDTHAHHIIYFSIQKF